MPHHHHSREEIAKIEIGHTQSTQGINLFLLIFFFFILFAVPIVQAFFEIKESMLKKTLMEKNDATYSMPSLPQFCDVFTFIFPKRTEVRELFKSKQADEAVRKAQNINNRILSDIKKYETDLKDKNIFVKWIVPPVQTVITGFLEAGNEDAYCGYDSWLFYRRDIDYLTGKGFMDKEVLFARSRLGNETDAAIQPDPVPAILDFRDQLAKRGIELLLVPVPVKPSIYPEKFSSAYVSCARPLRNPSHAVFIEKMRQNNVNVYDPADALVAERVKNGKDIYLKTDTHWTPVGMKIVADAIAERVENLLGNATQASGKAIFSSEKKEISNIGDIAMMLKLAYGEKFYNLQKIDIHEIHSGNYLWKSAPDSEILLLGDSFANIFSLGGMGWGESAGLAEQLSYILGRHLDLISRNDSGSFATREILSTEMRNGRDRLAGKKIVIWEFAERELAFGNWKLIDLALSPTQVDKQFFVPAPASEVCIIATVSSVTPAPRPGTVPYKDHIVAIHLSDLHSEDFELIGKNAVVLTWSMKNNVWTDAPGLRIGEKIKIMIKNWNDVEKKYGAYNITLPENEELIFAPFCWADKIEK